MSKINSPFSCKPAFLHLNNRLFVYKPLLSLGRDPRQGVLKHRWRQQSGVAHCRARKGQRLTVWGAKRCTTFWLVRFGGLGCVCPWSPAWLLGVQPVDWLSLAFGLKVGRTDTGEAETPCESFARGTGAFDQHRPMPGRLCRTAVVPAYGVRADGTGRIGAEPDKLVQDSHGPMLIKELHKPLSGAADLTAAPGARWGCLWPGSGPDSLGTAVMTG
ncbi:hypothetical protein NDU88_006350 [Pleurodeles waltl]|uniref:Uncharacterized protein n=1 Tax=Pleurodeles waltl TaxID=8319 RepID=A0AAV7PKN0_PLEWA|nr:hypothetical protein NDU88_006350 [Pleurodeles waltl]